MVSLRNLILKILFPFNRWMGKQHMPFTRKKMTAHDYHSLLEIARSGDVILTQVSGEMTNLFIPGHWTHAAIFCQQVGRPPYVIEAVGKGVVKKDLIGFLMKKDSAVLVRPSYVTQGHQLQAARLALKQVGKPYDYEFRSSSQAFYCAELVWYVYDQVSSGPSMFVMRETLGEKTVLPQDIANASRTWHKLWYSTHYREKYL